MEVNLGKSHKGIKVDKWKKNRKESQIRGLVEEVQQLPKGSSRNRADKLAGEMIK